MRISQHTIDKCSVLDTAKKRRYWAGDCDLERSVKNITRELLLLYCKHISNIIFTSTNHIIISGCDLPYKGLAMMMILASRYGTRRVVLSSPRELIYPAFARCQVGVGWCRWPLSVPSLTLAHAYFLRAPVFAVSVRRDAADVAHRRSD